MAIEKPTITGQESVKHGTTPIDHKRTEEIRASKNYKEEPPAEPVEEVVEGETPAGQEVASQEGAEPTQAGEVKDDPTERFVQALLDKLDTKNKADRQSGETMQDVAFDQQIEQQREEAYMQAQKQLADTDQKLLDLQAKLESGDLEVSQYLLKADALKDAKHSVERNLDKQMMHFDNQIQRHQDRIEQDIRKHRESYAQANPDFVQNYQSGKIQEAMQDPQIRNVFGDNPAAVNEHLRAQQFAQENQSLKARIAELEKTQQAAIKKGAEEPKHVGKSAGTNQHKTAPQAGRQDPNAAYLALLEQMRSGTA